MYNKPEDWGPKMNQTGPCPKTIGRGQYRHIVTVLPKTLWPSWRVSQRRASFEGQTCQKKDKDIAGRIQKAQRPSSRRSMKGGWWNVPRGSNGWEERGVTKVTWN